MLTNRIVVPPSRLYQKILLVAFTTVCSSGRFVADTVTPSYAVFAGLLLYLRRASTVTFNHRDTDEPLALPPGEPASRCFWYGIRFDAGGMPKAGDAL